MVRIGKLTDYALLITSQMAKEKDMLLSASALAEALHLPLPTVSKILKILSDAGLVSSVRGAEGGYLLTRDAQNISVADVITAMEGEFALTECCESVSPCVISTQCHMRENWLTINKLIHAFLSQLSLLDMLKPLAPMQLARPLLKRFTHEQ